MLGKLTCSSARAGHSLHSAQPCVLLTSGLTQEGQLRSECGDMCSHSPVLRPPPRPPAAEGACEGAAVTGREAGGGGLSLKLPAQTKCGTWHSIVCKRASRHMGPTSKKPPPHRALRGVHLESLELPEHLPCTGDSWLVGWHRHQGAADNVGQGLPSSHQSCGRYSRVARSPLGSPVEASLPGRWGASGTWSAEGDPARWRGGSASGRDVEQGVGGAWEGRSPGRAQVAPHRTGHPVESELQAGMPDLCFRIGVCPLLPRTYLS